MRSAGGRVSGNVGASKRVTTTWPAERSTNADTYALSRFDRKPPLPPSWSKSAGPTVGDPVTPMATAEPTLTNLRHFGGPEPDVAGRSGSACWETASLTPPTAGFDAVVHGDAASPPLPSAGSTVTVGSPTPPVSSRPLSGM